jgi:hypothetical protein
MTIVTARCDARHTYRPATCRAAVPMRPRNRAARRGAREEQKEKSERKQSPVEEIEIRCKLTPGTVECKASQREFVGRGCFT